LLARWPSPVVALNRAVALSYADSPEAALDVIRALSDDPALSTYPYLAATHADLLRRTGRRQEAIAAYEEAITFTGNTVEADYLTRQLDDLRNPKPGL
jgi:RNA polymerase sigma-70 factor (ECF subfamily)